MAVLMVIDTATGDSGKGKIAAFLAQRRAISHFVAGTNGPSSAHEVWIDGTSRTFRLIPHVSDNPLARYYVGPGTLVHVPTLVDEVRRAEAQGQVDMSSRVFVDYRCGLVEEDAVAEERRAGLHELGLTWEAGTTSARADYLWRRARRAESLDATHFQVGDVPAMLNALVKDGESVLVLGAHGPVYSLYTGLYYPHTTSDECSVVGTLARTGLAWSALTEVYGVHNMVPTTTLPIPLQHEMSDLEIRGRGLRSRGVVSGALKRVASRPDDALLDRFVQEQGPTALVLGRADLFDPLSAGATAPTELSSVVIDYIADIEAKTGLPVRLVSTGRDVKQTVEMHGGGTET